VVCRVVESPNAPASSTPRDQVAIIVVTRSNIAANHSSAYTVINHPDTVGHTAVNGPHIGFYSLRVPSFNLLAPPGQGADIVEMAFTASGAMVGAMGVGIMRRAFEKAWTWASSEMRGSKERMVEKQSVADLLIRMKIRCEAARGLTWRACEALEGGRGGELAYEAKIFGSEGAVETVMDAINLVGVLVEPFNDCLQHYFAQG
jgi:alkylation response protein AidB-like acyl-CoA dehydrogenase